MTDIVERLRKWAECDVRETGRDGTFEQNDAEKWASMMEEAADEILALSHDIDRHLAIASEQANEIERLRSLSEWRPIDEKAKSGEWVQVFGPHSRGGVDCQMVVRWAGGDWISSDDGYGAYIKPTAWLPLPPPPKEKDMA